MDRRRFLSVAAAGTAVLAATKRSARAQGRQPAAVPSLGIQAGARIERWSVVSVGDVEGGGIAVVMTTDGGEQFQVDVLARDDAQPGVARTARFDLYLCNQGGGRLVSNEEHGLGAMALGRALDGIDAPAPKLMTLRERNRQFRDGAFAVLRRQYQQQ